MVHFTPSSPVNILHSYDIILFINTLRNIRNVSDSDPAGQPDTVLTNAWKTVHSLPSSGEGRSEVSYDVTHDWARTGHTLVEYVREKY